MMRIALSAAVLAVMLLFDVPASQAQYIGNAPWCAVANIGWGTMEWDCEYYSVEECAPHVISGNRGTCEINPYWKGPLPRAGKPRRRWRRR